MSSYVTHREKRGGGSKKKTTEDIGLLLVDKLEELIEVQKDRLIIERFVVRCRFVPVLTLLLTISE